MKALLGTAITEFETTWITVLPAVLAEVAEVQRAKKLIWARSLASALSQIGHPLPADTTNALDCPGWSFDADGRIRADLFRPDDPATISDDQLDVLLARFTSRAFHCRIDGSNYFLGSISAIGAFQKLDPSYGSLVRVSSLWMRILFHVLEATGIEDGPGEEATAKLESMGPVFECKWRRCPKQPAHRMTFSQIVSLISRPFVAPCISIAHFIISRRLMSAASLTPKNSTRFVKGTYRLHSHLPTSPTRPEM